MAGMETGSLFRVIMALFRPAVALYRLWRPNTDRESIATLSDQLAAKVRKEEERLRRALRAERSSYMPVTFTATAPPHRADEVLGSAEVDDIATYFELPDQRHRHRLVVLGLPGSGKTVAATYLVTGLLDKRRDLADARRADEPVPVRVDAAGWDGRQEFTRWLITRLGYDHLLRPNVAQEMVDRGLILPVIDGLDEMDTHDGAESRARALLDRLNHTPWRDRPVVVLCRTTEFEQLTELGEDNGLHGAVTVTLQPLLTGQVVDYLTNCQHDIGTPRAAWNEITAHLRGHPSGPLATALQTPWLLGLTVSTLLAAPVTAGRLVTTVDPDLIREQLFAAQIPAAVATTGGSAKYRDHTSENVENWLRTLARCLQRRRDTGRDGTSIGLDEIWELAGITRIRTMHTIVAGAVAGLMTGLAFWLISGAGVALAFGPLIMCTVAYAVWSDVFPTAVRVAWSVPVGSRWSKGFVGGLMAGIAAGIAAGIVTGFTAGIVEGLTSGLTIGPLVGTAVGLTAGLRTSAADQLALVVDERRIIRDDIRAAALGIAFFGLMGMGGLTLGMDGAITLGLATGLVVGSTAGIVATQTGGFVGGLAASRYFLAVMNFYCTKEFSAKPVLFLDWARRNGLLRVSGTAYQFRHETYRQWIHDHGSTGETIGVAPTGGRMLR
ncbi:NACHT domain-containing protein [Nocardia sp. NPDC001965]